MGPPLSRDQVGRYFARSLEEYEDELKRREVRGVSSCLLCPLNLPSDTLWRFQLHMVQIQSCWIQSK